MAKHVLVHKTSGSLGSQVANPSLITDGDIALYNGSTAAVLAANYSGVAIPFFYAQGVPSGRNPRLSPIIKAGAVKSITKKAYTAPVQPVFNVGYAGSGATTINFLAASGTTNVPYGIKLENMITTTPPFPKAYAQFTLRASIGAANNNPVYVVDQLAKDLNQQLTVMPSIDGGTFALVNVLSDITLATAPASGGTPTVAYTNGSPTLVITSGSTLTNAAGLAAGCWIRIGGSAAENPIYQIASVTATSSLITTVVLTRPFVGTSVTAGAIGTVMVGSSASVLPTSSSLAGLKVSVIGSYFTANLYASGKLNNYINIPLQDTLAGTPIANPTPMVFGSGTYDNVLKKEYEALGELGVENRTWMPYPNDTYAVNGVQYIGYSIYYENPVSDKSAQGQSRVESGTLDIYVVSGTTVTNFDAALAAVTGVTIS
jgi:hypothetical protein